MDIVKEMISIKEKIPYFIEHQRSNKKEGYYSYSYTGDIYDETVFWNIPGTLFALDTAYVIGMYDDNIANAVQYLKSFQHENGYIYSDFIRAKIFWPHMVGQLKSCKITDIHNMEYVRAETRQVMRTLNIYDSSIVDKIPKSEILTEDEICKFLNQLNWNEPWSAGSHFSHLVFFEKMGWKNKIINEDEYINRIGTALRYLDNLWNPKVGAWGEKRTSLQQYINGAMKILTGLELIEDYKLSDERAFALVDLCLDNINELQACDNYNVIYILSYLKNKIGKYRSSEIQQFAENKFQKYLEFYYPQYGGFSFYKKNANDKYYGFKISEGKNEPDMHGTRMYIWGMDLIAQLLNIEEEVGLRRLSE
jgi:hypothetical protein